MQLFKKIELTVFFQQELTVFIYLLAISLLKTNMAVLINYFY